MVIIQKTTPAIEKDDYGPFKIIPLTHGKYAKVSPEDFNDLNKYHWQSRKSQCRYYAMRKLANHGYERWIRMHREVAATPRGMVTHHKNRNTLDNRRGNLQNLSPLEHRAFHLHANLHAINET